MVIWCEIVCDCCARSTSGRFVTGLIPRREMKAEAKAEGWKFQNQFSFCSDFCVSQYAWRIEDDAWQKKYAADLAALGK